MMRNLFPLVLGLYGVAFAIPLAGSEGSDGDGEGTEDPGYVPGDEGDSLEIVNGADIKNDYEWQEVVHLAISAPSGGGNCTGSLINPDWILTAAHCIPDDATGITITFGNNADDTRKVQAEPDGWILHQGWNGDDLTDLAYDIAVVKLATPVDDVRPMALNDQPITDDWLDQQVTYVGFGITRTGRSDSGQKRIADFPIVDVQRDRIGAWDGIQSTCRGDSGGPGMVVSGNTYSQISIVSYGALDCGTSASYSQRVDAKLAWLRSRGVSYTTKPGAPPTFVCNREQNPDAEASRAVGVVDFDLKCQVDYHDMANITGATWNWGDGESSEGIDAEHVYTVAGNHTMRVCIQGQSVDDETDEATAWQHCITRPGYVLACDVPDVDFSAEQIDGLTWQFINQTDLSTFGCIQNVAWEIYNKGDAEPFDTFQSWEPEYEFPEKGEYTVVLNVGGMGGTAGSTLDLVVKRTGGSNARGCDSTGGTLGFGALFLALGLPLLRRRRED